MLLCPVLRVALFCQVWALCLVIASSDLNVDDDDVSASLFHSLTRRRGLIASDLEGVRPANHLVRPLRPAINPKVSWDNFRQLADVNERKDRKAKQDNVQRIKKRVEGNMLRSLVNELSRLLDERSNCGKGRRSRKHRASRSEF